MACLSGKVALIQLSFLSPVSCLVATHRWKHCLFFFPCEIWASLLCALKTRAQPLRSSAGQPPACTCTIAAHGAYQGSLSGEPSPPLFSSPLPNLLHHTGGMILTKSDIALTSGHRALWSPPFSCHCTGWSNPQKHLSRSTGWRTSLPS